MTAMTTPDLPALLLTGEPRHGVARYARDLAGALRRREPGIPLVTEPDPAALVRAAAGHRRCHLHVTDRMLAGSPAEAAELVGRIAGVTRLTVTLHDVPQESDGPRNLLRRGAAYTRVCQEVAGVAVNSGHEAALLAEHRVVPDPARVRVIPLGATPGPVPRVTAVPADGVTALVAGWVYPGKGHEEVIRAVAAAAGELGPPAGTVIAAGAPSPGHQDEVDRLTALAGELGVRFRITGGLTDREYADALRAPGVPVAAHRHLSASRTLLDWGEQGRRPLVADSRYAREMAALRPGTLHLCADGELAGALAAAHRDPALTVLPPGTGLAPTLDDVAGAYLDWWRG